MSEKVIEVTTTRRVRVCDRCEKQTDSYYTCKICRREMCVACERLLDASGPIMDVRRVLGYAMNVCLDCQAAGVAVCGVPYIDIIRAAVAEADAKIADALDRWRAWSAEWRARKEVAP